jgi:hypothetical protein
MDSVDPGSANMMRISTRDLPEHNRIATICDLYGRTILKHDIEPIGNRPFEFEASLYSLPGLGLASTVIGPCRHRADRNISIATTWCSV